MAATKTVLVVTRLTAAVPDKCLETIALLKVFWTKTFNLFEPLTSKMWSCVTVLPGYATKSFGLWQQTFVTK